MKARLTILTMLLLTGLPIWPQVAGPALPFAYSQGRDLITGNVTMASVLSGNQADILRLMPNGKTAPVHLPKGGMDFHVFNDELYCRVNQRPELRVDRTSGTPPEPTIEKKILVYKSIDGNNWDLACWANPVELAVASIRPMGRGLYLIGSTSVPYQDSDVWSWFALARADSKGKLSLDRILDVTLPGPVPRRRGESLLTANQSNTVYDFRLLPIDSGWALVHMWLGRGFTVRRVGESIKSSAFQVYPQLDGKPLKDIVEPVVLGAYAAPTGGLLLATRTLKGVLGEGRSTVPEPPSKVPDVLKAQREARILHSLIDHPEVNYWDVDAPFTKVLPTTPPAGAPSSIPNPKELGKLVFYLDTKGRATRISP